MSRDSPFDDQHDYRHLTQVSCKRPRLDDVDEGKRSTGSSVNHFAARHEPMETRRITNTPGITRFATTRTDSLSSKQIRFIQQWITDFRESSEYDDIWPDKRVTALATAIGADVPPVEDYVRQQHGNTEGASILPHKSSSVPSSERSSSYPPFDTYKSPSANTHLPSTTLTLVDKYVAACRRRRSQTDGRRSVNKGPYRCTFGCGYRTKRAFDWRRHEETHEPQELWLCELCCQKDALNPFLVNRRDKFLRHAADKHTEYSAEKVLEMSKVPYVPRAAEGCPFSCGEVVKGWSWDERCKHILGHFEDAVERSNTKRIVIKEGKDSGDEDDRESISESAGSAGSNEDYEQ